MFFFLGSERSGGEDRGLATEHAERAILNTVSVFCTGMLPDFQPQVVYHSKESCKRGQKLPRPDDS